MHFRHNYLKLLNASLQTCVPSGYLECQDPDEPRPFLQSHKTLPTLPPDKIPVTIRKGKDLICVRLGTLSTLVNRSEACIVSRPHVIVGHGRLGVESTYHPCSILEIQWFVHHITGCVRAREVTWRRKTDQMGWTGFLQVPGVGRYYADTKGGESSRIDYRQGRAQSLRRLRTTNP